MPYLRLRSASAREVQVDDVDLPKPLVRRIDADLAAVAAPAGVEVAAPVAAVFRRGVEAGDARGDAGGDVEEEQVLAAVLVGVGVGDHPTAVRGKCAMAVARQDVGGEDLRLGAVGVCGIDQLVVPLVGRVLASENESAVVEPIEMRRALDGPR